jgi:hypothetical protein
MNVISFNNLEMLLQMAMFLPKRWKTFYILRDVFSKAEVIYQIKAAKPKKKTLIVFREIRLL